MRGFPWVPRAVFRFAGTGCLRTSSATHCFWNFEACLPLCGVGRKTSCLQAREPCQHHPMHANALDVRAAFTAVTTAHLATVLPHEARLHAWPMRRSQNCTVLSQPARQVVSRGRLLLGCGAYKMTCAQNVFERLVVLHDLTQGTCDMSRVATSLEECSRQNPMTDACPDQLIVLGEDMPPTMSNITAKGLGESSNTCSPLQHKHSQSRCPLTPRSKAGR